MRISELITMLHKAQDEHGDIDVAVGQSYWDADEHHECNELRSEITLNISSNYAFDKKYCSDRHCSFNKFPFVDSWGLDIDTAEEKAFFHTGEHCLVIGYKGPNWFVLNDASEQYKLRLQEYQEMLRREQKALDTRMSALCAALAKTGG